MLRALIDTCIWLDLAKDRKQSPLLIALENLVADGEVSLIVPRIVLEEVARNKERIIKESQQSVSSACKNARRTVEMFGSEAGKASALAELLDIDHRLVSLGEDVNGSIGKVEKLLMDSNIIETSDEVKIRVADRAIHGLAPFHRKNKNSVDDTILVEIYADTLAAEQGQGNAFAFVSSNHSDFSAPGGDHREPHADIAALFVQPGSGYFLDLLQPLKLHAGDWFVDFPEVDLENADEEPRRRSEIVEAVEGLVDKVWYHRHQRRAEEIDKGATVLVDNFKLKLGRRYPQVLSRIAWGAAEEMAAKVEMKHPDGLGPWSQFEWGMINGKLSALRWALGDEWDMLDT